MRKLIDPEIMRRCEAEYFRTSGVASIDVMERAAHVLAEVARSRFPEARRVCIACGPGGNGGDGYACARLLREAGLEVRVFPSAPAKSPDAVANAERARALGIPFLDPSAEADVPDLWIDCLYGTGLSRAPSGASAELIARMNCDRAAGASILAADIPSGLNGATGARFEPCVEADCTVSFQFAKPGHLLGDGLDACGELTVADVGFPEAAFPNDLPRLVEPNELRGLFEPRRRNIHKGSCGHLLIVAGSLGMAGAAALCARAALRSGAGLVTVACPANIVPILQTLAPCAMCVPMPEREGVLSPEAVEPLRAVLAGKSAAVIGPGLTRRAPVEAVRAVLESGIPAVVDADALNLLAENRVLLPLLRSHHVLTPHPGEAARLLGHPIADPIADARELAMLGTAERAGTVPSSVGHASPSEGAFSEDSPSEGAPSPSCSNEPTNSSVPGPTAVLKGASRVIAGAGETYVSTSGAPGMARGGSGDVYAGILGALLAEKSARTPAQSAAAACELHGVAGELAQAKYGPRAMNSADLLEFLPEAFRRCVD